MTKEEYMAYLQSEAWAIRRQACLDRFGGQCALCENKAWHAHHRTYDRVGREHLNDLAALCGECHEKYHGKGKFEDVEVEVMLEAKRRREAKKEQVKKCKAREKELAPEFDRLEIEKDNLKREKNQVFVARDEARERREREIDVELGRIEAQEKAMLKELRELRNAARSA